jgi:hypothetical protein
LFAEPVSDNPDHKIFSISVDVIALNLRPSCSKSVPEKRLNITTLPLRHFLELRDKLVISPSAWSLRHGPHRRYGQRLLVARRLHKGEGRGYVARLPEAVFTELLSGQEGNWCAIWRAVLKIPHRELTCARWFLALVAADLELSSVGWAGQYAPKKPVNQAWRVLRIKKGAEKTL